MGELSVFEETLFRQNNSLNGQYSVWLRDGRSGFDPRQRQRIFLLAPASRPALRPTQPPIQWVPEVLSPGVKRGRGVTLTTHPYLVPRLRMSRSYTSSPPQAPPWRVAGQFYFTSLNTYPISALQKVAMDRKTFLKWTQSEMDVRESTV
jgi:hypothetical protein